VVEYKPVIIQERPIPKPGNSELLIKVKSVGLNPLDCICICELHLTIVKIIEYGLPMATPPAILGMEVAGSVEKIGSGVTNYKNGDKVYKDQNNNH
jgi:NADPH:quinone reductase-like Zn-dependent oxidoreductase